MILGKARFFSSRKQNSNKQWTVVTHQVLHCSVVLALPAGAKGSLGSSSERSVLILLPSEGRRHWDRADRLSTLPPLDRGRERRGSP